MEDFVRNWNCRGCGHTNRTVVEPDGTVKCEYCRDVKSIQPSRNRGGETPGQISRFSRPISLPRADQRKPGRRDLDQLSGDRHLREDSEKRESFLQLRERYVEAQQLVSSDEPYANLEWILGVRRNITRDPLDLETKTIELAALWLQDLAAEVDRRLPSRPTGDFDVGASPSRQAGDTNAQNLRDATARLLLAFKISSANRAGGAASRPFDGGTSP